MHIFHLLFAHVSCFHSVASIPKRDLSSDPKIPYLISFHLATHLSYEFSAQYSTFCLSFLGLSVFHNLIVFYVHLHHSLPLEAIILLNAYTLNLPIPLRFSHTKYSHTSFSIAVAFQGKLQLIIKLLLLC